MHLDTHDKKYLKLNLKLKPKQNLKLITVRRLEDENKFHKEVHNVLAFLGLSTVWRLTMHISSEFSINKYGFSKSEACQNLDRGWRKFLDYVMSLGSLQADKSKNPRKIGCQVTVSTVDYTFHALQGMLRSVKAQWHLDIDWPHSCCHVSFR